MDDAPLSLFEPSWKKYRALALICVLYTAFAYWWMGPSLLIPMFWGLVFVTPLVMDFVPRLFRHPHHKALEEFQGVHYMFGGTRVRVLYAGGLVWVATQDVYDALGLRLGKQDLRRLLLGKKHCMIPGTQIVGISEVHLAHFVSGMRSDEAQRFTWWFEREVVKPIKTRIDRGLPVAEAVE